MPHRLQNLSVCKIQNGRQGPQNGALVNHQPRTLHIWYIQSISSIFNNMTHSLTVRKFSMKGLLAPTPPPSPLIKVMQEGNCEETKCRGMMLSTSAIWVWASRPRPCGGPTARDGHRLCNSTSNHPLVMALRPSSKNGPNRPLIRSS